MRRPSFKTILVCIGIFLFFLVLRFPFQNLRGYVFKQIYDATKVSVTADDMSLNILGWPGLSFSNVDVLIPGAVMQMPGSDFNVIAKKLVVRGRLVGFFPPKLGVSVSISGIKQGGELYVKVTPLSNPVMVNFELDKVGFPALFPETVARTAKGTVSGDGDFSLDQVDFAKSAGWIELTMDQIVTPEFVGDGFPYPSVDLGPIKAKASMKASSLEIENFIIGTNTSDLSGSISGDIKFEGSVNFLQSRLNIQCKFAASDKYQTDERGSGFRSVLNTFDARNRDKKWEFRVTKSLAEIARDPLNATRP